MNKYLIPAALSLCFFLCSCAKTVQEHTKTLFSMDTVMELKIYSENEKPLADAEAEIKRIDALFDRGSSSEIYKINNESPAAVSDETAGILRTAAAISERTDGAFDITTAPVSDLWGFYGGTFRVPSEDEINTTLKNVGFNKIHFDGNTVSLPALSAVDLGGIAKGYASDRVSELLKSSGVSSAIISLGGNVYAVGSKPDGSPWSVGITDPKDKNALAGTVNVSDKAVVTSGGYQRYFISDGVTYHHIIDPKTGKSAESGLSSVTVISSNGTLADGLSTALFVSGLDKSIEIWRESDDFDAVFITDSGEIYITEGIADSFNSQQSFSIIR